MKRSLRAVLRLTSERRQPTLESSREAPPAADLAGLCLVETAALLALIRSTSDRAPTTPCFGLTLALAMWMEQRGVITLCDERQLLPATPPARAIYDPVAWRYRWPEAGHADFVNRLLSQLRNHCEAAGSSGLKVVLWQLLANAEVEGYLAYLLRKHGFDPAWALDARDQGERWTKGLTLAQVRYVVWASVREGAAAYLRSDGELDDARAAIALEVRRRSRWLETRPALGASFLPAPTTRQSVLLSIFLEEVAPIGQQYWLSCPTEASLRRLLADRP